MSHKKIAEAGVEEIVGPSRKGVQGLVDPTKAIEPGWMDEGDVPSGKSAFTNSFNSELRKPYSRSGR